MRHLPVIAVLLALAACTNVVPPPVEYGTPLRSRHDLPRGPQGVERPQEVTVKKGDTVYALSRRYKVSPRSLITANGLKAPYSIQPGQKLQVPYPRIHRVKSGETIYGISRGYGMDMTLLARLNGVKPPYTIKVGEELVLPAVGEAPPAPQEPEEPPLVEPVAKPAKVETAELAPPPTTKPAPKEAPKAKSTQEIVAVAPPPAKTKPATKPVTKPAPKPKAKAEVKPQAKSVPLKTVAVDESVSRYGFSWPLRGKVLSDFGPKGRGLHNDGVNIRAANGAPVRAAADGKVAYAGNELRGYGNLLLIRHTNGWTTAYAHNSKLLVRRGQEVKRGTLIAKAGRTGGVETTQLHFEIRKGKQAVDPIRYLP